MALNNQKNFVIAAVVLLLAVVGAAAWIHNSGSRSLAAPLAVTDATGYAPNPALGGSLVADAGDGYYPSIGRPAYIRQPEASYAVARQPQSFESQDANAANDGNDGNGQYNDGNGQYTEVRRSGRTYREYHHGRSKRHSVEIVAGTAAAGAAIGAIAGGGPGAAIGAVSGAGAGFIYDRLTHNH